MYYDLTKEQYKEMEKKFRKTFIGKMCFMKCMAMFAIAIVMLVMFLILPTLGAETETGDIVLFMAITTTIICEALMSLNYKGELKDYILSEKK